MGKSKKNHQHTSKGSTEASAWLLPAKTTKASGIQKQSCGKLVDVPFIGHSTPRMSVHVQSLAIATTYIKKQVCLRYYVEACEALFLKSAVAAVQSTAGDISYIL